MLALFLDRNACAQSEELRYKVGNTVFSEDGQRLVIGSVPPTLVEIAAGGKLWPPVSVDESNHIHAGAAIIDASSWMRIAAVRPAPGETVVSYPHGLLLTVKGDGFQFTRHDRSCHFSPKTLGLGAEKSALASLKDGNLRLATSDGAIRALVTQFSGAGSVAGYQVDSIDLASCTVSVKKLGKPDLLVELAATGRGGWWITGAIEQTLLRSLDGKTWQKVALPRELSSLVSSYVVNAREIWLAAILATDGEPSPYLLVYSGNAGKTWKNLKQDDPLLMKLPSAWLEGQRRVAMQSDPVAELAIPNFEAGGAACHVRVAVKDEQCVDQRCVFPAAKGAPVEPVALHLTCLPTAAPTGFENPAPYVKVRALRTASGNGSLSVIDDINTPAPGRQQDVSFCIYGIKNNLCGYAKIAKVHGKEPQILEKIIALIKRIQWHDI